MDEMIFAAKQNRNIPKEDKIFGISNRAKAMIAKEGKDKVVNATIGALLDDEGELIVLSSVDEGIRGIRADRGRTGVSGGGNQGRVRKLSAARLYDCGRGSGRYRRAA